MLMVDATYTALGLPIVLAYGTLRPFSPAFCAELAIGWLFAADLVLGFHTAFVLQHSSRLRRPQLISDGLGIARHYILHGTFLADLLAALPWFAAVLVYAPLCRRLRGALPSLSQSCAGGWADGAYYSPDSSRISSSLSSCRPLSSPPPSSDGGDIAAAAFKVSSIRSLWGGLGASSSSAPAWGRACCSPLPLMALTALRYIRLARIIRLLRAQFLGSFVGRLVLSSVQASKMHISSATAYGLTLTYSAAVLINLVACVWRLIARAEGTQHSWLSDVGQEDLSDAPGHVQYVASLHWAVTTLTTTGFGDIAPHTSAERLWALTSMLLGMLLLSLVVGSLVELVATAGEDTRLAAAYRAKMDTVAAWLDAMEVSGNLRRRIVSFYSEGWLEREAQRQAWSRCLDELPHGLRTQLVWEATQVVLRSLPAFGELGDAEARHVAARLRPLPLGTDQDLCLQGASESP